MDVRPQFDTAWVYRTVADLLPTEGRDFNLKLATATDGRQSIVLEGLTPMGMAWLPFLKERLEHPLKTQGVGVEQHPRTRPDEFDAKLQARLRDQHAADQNNETDKNVA